MLYYTYIYIIKYIVQKYEHRLHNAERIYENNVCVHVPKAKIYTACLFYQDCIQKTDQNQQIILLPIQAVATSMDYVEKSGKSFLSIYVKKSKYNMIYSNLYTVFICVQILSGIVYRLHNAERNYENNVCLHVPKAKIYTACSLDQDCIQKSDQNQQIEYCCQSRL